MLLCAHSQYGSDTQLKKSRVVPYLFLEAHRAENAKAKEVSEVSPRQRQERGAQCRTCFPPSSSTATSCSKGRSRPPSWRCCALRRAASPAASRPKPTPCHHHAGSIIGAGNGVHYACGATALRSRQRNTHPQLERDKTVGAQVGSRRVQLWPVRRGVCRGSARGGVWAEGARNGREARVDGWLVGPGRCRSVRGSA